MTASEYARLDAVMRQERFRELRRIVDFIREPVMTYPYGPLLAPLTGFIGRDADGLEGLQFHYQHGLQGPYSYNSGRKGYDLQLTIDLRDQKRIEVILSQAMTQYQARDGQVVLLRVADARIMALASMPSGNPNRVQEAAPWAFRLRPVTDYFQLGSMAYPLLVMASLENRGLSDAARNSFLAVAPETGSRLLAEAGLEGVYSILEKLRISERTGVDFSGEVTGIYRKGGTPEEQKREFAPGYGIAASLLRLAVSTSAMINGGELRTPRLVARFDNGWHSGEIPSRPAVRALSEQSSAVMRKLLVEFMTKNGGAANIGGYWEAHNSNELRPFPPKHIVSGLFFAPADQPKYLLLIKLQLPDGPVLPSDREIPLHLGREMLAGMEQKR